MEKLGRKPFQGVGNIVRFNWHYYLASFSALIILFFIKSISPPNLAIVAEIIIYSTILITLIPLLISYYVYDYSNLYSLNWLNTHDIGTNKNLVNINAGFDEMSALISIKYPHSQLRVLDFYDPAKHTEISISRARKAYPAFPGTEVISTSNTQLKPNSADYIFLILAAHEIRNGQERIAFFKQLQSSLSPDGRIIVVEHQRDIANFLAYNFGFFHFLSKKEWRKTFAGAGLLQVSESKITSFITVFILK